MAYERIKQCSTVQVYPNPQKPGLINHAVFYERNLTGRAILRISSGIVLSPEVSVLSTQEIDIEVSSDVQFEQDISYQVSVISTGCVEQSETYPGPTVREVTSERCFDHRFPGTVVPDCYRRRNNNENKCGT